MRKDYYVQDKFVLIPYNANTNENFQNIINQSIFPYDLKDENKCPYFPGNKQFSDQLVL